MDNEQAIFLAGYDGGAAYAQHYHVLTQQLPQKTSCVTKTPTDITSRPSLSPTTSDASTQTRGVIQPET